MIPARTHGKYIIRFCVVSQHATEEDIGKFFFYFKTYYIGQTMASSLTT